MRKETRILLTINWNATVTFHLVIILRITVITSCPTAEAKLPMFLK